MISKEDWIDKGVKWELRTNSLSRHEICYWIERTEWWHSQNRSSWVKHRTEKSTTTVKCRITYRWCADIMMGYGRRLLLLKFRLFVRELFFVIDFFFFDRIGFLIHLLHKLFNGHFGFFTWVLNWRNHLFDLNEGRFDGFTFPFVELSTQNVQRLSKFLHRLSVTLFKL